MTREEFNGVAWKAGTLVCLNYMNNLYPQLVNQVDFSSGTVLINGAERIHHTEIRSVVLPQTAADAPLATTDVHS